VEKCLVSANEVMASMILHNKRTGGRNHNLFNFIFIKKVMNKKEEEKERTKTKKDDRCLALL